MIHKDYNMTKEYKNEIEKIDEGIIQPTKPRLNTFLGDIETVTTIPSSTPLNFEQSIKFYTDSLTSPSVYRIYFYIPALNVWKYTSLT